MDDYSRKLFPVGQMITAYLEGNNFGFEDIDDSYIDIIDNKLVGTLGIGSRRSEHYVRIYTVHKYFVRWETELKQDKAQDLFDKLASFPTDKTTNSLPIEAILKTLKNAAIGKMYFGDKSSVSNPKNATKKRTKSLPFWQKFESEVCS